MLLCHALSDILVYQSLSTRLSLHKILNPDVVLWEFTHRMLLNDVTVAAESDGKARDSLHKLQLFRQFYVMVLTYIYFSRVIVYLLTATMPFHLQWLGQLCLELGTLYVL